MKYIYIYMYIYIYILCTYCIENVDRCIYNIKIYNFILPVLNYKFK